MPQVPVPLRGQGLGVVPETHVHPCAGPVGQRTAGQHQLELEHAVQGLQTALVAGVHVDAATTAAAQGARPCGGSGAYATGIGVRTDTNNGFSGYGGSFEGYGNDTPGNKATNGGYVSIYVR